jgi:hypothetical protein
MSSVFRKIDPPTPSPLGECEPPPPPLLVWGEDTLAGWRGGGGSIVRKTPETALYSIYTLCLIRTMTLQKLCCGRKGTPAVNPDILNININHVESASLPSSGGASIFAFFSLARLLSACSCIAKDLLNNHVTNR